MKKLLLVMLSVLTAALMLTVGASALILIDNCDEIVVGADKWEGPNINVTGDDVTEGEGAMIVRGDYLVSFAKAYNNGFDLTEYQVDGTLVFDYYIDDITLVSDIGYVSLTSTGNPSIDGMSYPMSNLELDSGWNHVEIPMADFELAAGGPDFAGINFFKVYMYTAGEITLKLDNLHVTLPDGKSVMIDSCESVLGETFDSSLNMWAGTSLEHLDSEMGGKCVSAATKTTMILQSYLTNPIDISEYAEDGVLFFDFYISDFTGMNYEGQVELTSSSTCDVNEITWGHFAFVINDGWNKIALPLSEAIGDEADYTAINYFRFYEFVAGEDKQEIRLDNIYFGHESEAIEMGYMEAPVETEPVEEPVFETFAPETDEAPVEDVADAAEDVVEDVADAANNAAAAAADEAKGLSTGAIAGIAAGGVVVVAAIVAAIVAASKKKKK